MRREVDENILLFSSEFLKQKEYWTGKLSGEIGETTLLEMNKKTDQPPSAAEIDIPFPGNVNRSIIKLSKQSDLSLYIILLTALKALVYRYTFNKDITVLSPVYTLNISKDTINNRVMIRDAVSGEMTFKELLLGIKVSVVEAYKNQDYPYKKLVEYILNPSHQPAVDSIFRLHCSLANIHRTKGIAGVDGSGEEISFHFEREDNMVKGRIVYDANRCESDYVQQLAEHYHRILEKGVEDLDRKISGIPILSGAERQRLLLEFNDNRTDFPRARTIYHFVETHAETHPDLVAVSSLENHLTYQRLNESVDRLAKVLQGSGIQADEPVGILMERSPLMVISILAVWKAGGAYIPIEPQNPPQRITGILKDSEAKVLITRQQDMPAPVVSDYKGKIIQWNREGNEITGEAAVPGPVKPEDDPPMDRLAYIIYTSGSTGKPKGVMVEHIGMMNHMQAKINELQLTGESVVAQNAIHTFDISVWQFFVALMVGGKTVICPDELVMEPDCFLERLINERVTILEVVPSYLSVLLYYIEEQNIRYLPLEYLLVTGEEVKPPLLRKWFDCYPHIKVVNAYGPTEASDDITHHNMNKAPGLDAARVPIGKPLQNLNIYIVDDHMQLCPIGVKGEICVSGVGVGRGYFGDEEKTRQVFVEDPFVEEKGVRLYKTGDLGCWGPDGTIEFFGRKDYQVKIRGFRIELEEIESRLLNHTEIKEAVVIDKENNIGNKYLCAYVVPHSQRLPEFTGLKKYLSESLPDYMIPAHFMRLESIPLTSSGKIDRKALPEPEGGEFTSKYVAPGSRVEKKLVEIWSGVLEKEKSLIGITHSFFDLGGHSLKAIVLVSKIHKEFDVKLPLPELFKTPTIRDLAQYIEKAVEDRFTSIEPVEKKEYYVLSSAQKRLYILQQMDLESTAYNMPQIIPLGEEPDLKRLEHTFINLIRRHESLRTSFYMENEQPVQRVHEHVDFKIEYYIIPGETFEPGVEGSTRSKDGHLITPKDQVIKRFGGAFELSQAPLLKVGIVKTDNEKYVLIVVMHHIICDGFSHIILNKDFMTFYEGKELSPLRIQYKDFSQWQKSKELEKLIKQQELYWVNTYWDDLPVLNLPTDYPRPLMQSFEGSSVGFDLTGQESQTLGNIAKEADATLYIAILAIYTVLLSKLSSQEDIIVGSPIAGRGHVDIENVIGMFANTLAMRNFPSAEKTFKEFITEVKARALEAFENQDFQFEELVEKVSLRRDTSRNPIFDVMFNLMNVADNTGETPESPKIEEQTSYKHIKGTSKFDLNLTAIEKGKNISFNFEYCTKLFKASTIDRIIGYFKKILSQLSASTALKLSDIDIITRNEKEKILTMSRGVEEPYNDNIDSAIHLRFEEQAAGTPDNIALVIQDCAAISYRELNKRANQLAAILRKKGVKSDIAVGVMVERSPEMIIALLAIMKAGGAYLPIDVEYPEARKKYMLQDSQVRLLLTNCGIESISGFIPADIEIIDVKKDRIYCDEVTNPVYMGKASDLVYIIYTSGSTGNPKGVMLEHRNLVNLIDFQYKYTNIDNRRVLQFATISFDVSFLEIFSVLLIGGRLYLINPEIRFNISQLFKYIEKNEINTLYLPMSFLRIVFNEDEFSSIFPRNVTHIETAGEQVTINDKFREYLKDNHVYLHNHYGPSEAHVVTTLTLDPAGDIPEFPSIGKPIMNTAIYILDKGMNLVPFGVPGELYIGGIQVGRGYLRREQLTAEKFKTSPFREGERIYKTGDLAKWLPDGNIDFLGRIDHQVKIRGFRVEPGEIESLLLNHPQIKDCVVTAETTPNGEKYLCAYYIARHKVEAPSHEQQEDTGAAVLREYLSQTLPDYMIPSFFIPLEKIPLTPNGKIDKKALSQLQKNLNFESKDEYIAPRDPIEKKLTELWADVLNMEKEVISIDNNFFQLGGQSLKAIVLLARIHKAFNVRIPLAEIFKTPSVKGIAQYIMKSGNERYTSIEPAEKKEYHVLSSAQKRLYILQQMDTQSAAYNMPTVIPVPEKPDLDAFERTFIKLIQRHESLRTSFHMVLDQPVQKIYDHVDFKIEYYEISDPVSGPTINQAYSQPGHRVMEHLGNTFDLSRAPLLRVGIVKTGEQNYLLVAVMHHIISDGVSLQVLEKDFTALYNGKELAPLRIQYKDFSGWQDREKETEHLKRQEAYWLKKFEGEIPVLNLPTDYPRPAVQLFKGAVLSGEIPIDIHRLKAIALENRATTFMVLAAIFNIYLYKVCGQEDIIIGTPVAGRRHSDLEKIIGMFVNSLPLRNRPERKKSFIEFLKEVRDNTLEAFDNQDYQFEDLVEKLAVKRDRHNPIFDVMFICQELDIEKNARPPAEQKEQKAYKHQTHQTSKFDFTLNIAIGKTLRFSFTYSNALFRKETIEMFADGFKEILFSILKDKNIKLKEIQVTTAFSDTETRGLQEELANMEF